MIGRIERSHDIAQSVDDMVRWCRSGESRISWPGASRIRYAGGLHYEVAMQTTGLPEVRLQFEEHLSDVEGQGSNRRFESVQLWKGPSGQIGTNWSEFSFTARGASGLRFDFTLHYMIAAENGFDPARYGQVSERTVDRYLAYLNQHIVLFRSAHCSAEVPARPEEVVDFCRSAQARRYWPGVRGTPIENGLLVYECGLAVPGIPQATVLVRERQGPVETEGRGFRFETESLWVWPGGELLNVWPSYQMTPGAKGSTLLELTLRFVTPAVVDGEPLNRARLDQAIRTAARRFVRALAGAMESRAHSGAQES